MIKTITSLDGIFRKLLLLPIRACLVQVFVSHIHLDYQRLEDSRMTPTQKVHRKSPSKEVRCKVLVISSLVQSFHSRCVCVIALMLCLPITHGSGKPPPVWYEDFIVFRYQFSSTSVPGSLCLAFVPSASSGTQAGYPDPFADFDFDTKPKEPKAAAKATSKAAETSALAKKAQGRGENSFCTDRMYIPTDMNRLIILNVYLEE